MNKRQTTPTCPYYYRRVRTPGRQKNRFAVFDAYKPGDQMPVFATHYKREEARDLAEAMNLAHEKGCERMREQVSQALRPLLK